MRLSRRLLILGAALFASLTSLGAQETAWFQHETEHFRIIYRGADREAAALVAGFAEEVYQTVTDYLGSSPERVDVVLYGETDLANGFYTPAPPQHIALYTRPPTTTFVGPRTESWLRILLIHELTHFVQANFKPGLFWTVGSIFGRSLTGLQLGLTPFWFVEGMAIVAETEFTQGGRGRDVAFEMLTRAPILEDRMFDLRQLGYSSHLAPFGRIYPAGHLIWDFLVDEYGQEVAADVVAEISRFPLFGVQGPIRRVTGARLSDVYDAAIAAASGSYPVIDGQSVRVTPATRSDYYPPRSVQNRVYTYRTRPDRLPAIVEIDLSTGVETIVLEGRLTDESSWSVSPSGRQIAVATITADRTYPDRPQIHSDIYLVDQEVGTWVPITEGGGIYQPAFSADARSIFAIRRRGQFSELIEIPIDTGVPRTIYAPDQTSLYSPAVAPDGTSVVVVANTNGAQTLHHIDLDSNTVRALTDARFGAPSSPRFTDAGALLYALDDGENLVLYSHDPETSAASIVATDPVAVLGGTLVGETLVFSAYTADGHALRRREFDPGNQHIRAIEESVDATPQNSTGTTAAAHPAHDQVALDQTRYVAVPWPRFWLPSVSLASSSLSLGSIGPGIQVFGADFLSRNSIAVASHYFPAVEAIDYSIAYSLTLGRWGAALEHASDVLIDSDELVDRGFATQVAITHTPLSSFALGVSTEARARIALSHRVTESGGPSLRPELAVTLSRTPSSPQNVVYSPGATALSISTIAAFDGAEFLYSGIGGRIAGGYSFGLGGAWTAVIRPAFALSTSESVLQPYALTGFETSAEEEATSSGKAQLEIRSPKLLFDLPVVRNLGLTGQSYALYLEAVAHGEPARLAFDPAIGIALEITTQVAFLAEIPVATGIRVRVDTETWQIDPANDLSFYIETDILNAIPNLP